MPQPEAWSTVRDGIITLPLQWAVPSWAQYYLIPGNTFNISFNSVFIYWTKVLHCNEKMKTHYLNGDVPKILNMKAWWEKYEHVYSDAELHLMKRKNEHSLVSDYFVHIISVAT